MTHEYPISMNDEDVTSFPSTSPTGGDVFIAVGSRRQSITGTMIFNGDDVHVISSMRYDSVQLPSRIPRKTHHPKDPNKNFQHLKENQRKSKKNY